MKEYNPNLPLASIHIPKCGGTSFKNALEIWFAENLYFHYYNEKRNIPPRKVTFSKWYSKKIIHRSCIHGHFNGSRNIGLNDYYPEINQAITFIRDPLDVQISIYHHNYYDSLKNNNYRNGREIKLNNSIDQFLEESEPYFKYFLPENINLENMEYFFNEFFVHVGIIERFQKSINILSDKLELPKINITHENKLKKLFTPSNSSVQVFKNKCHFEYQLYEKAKQIN